MQPLLQYKLVSCFWPVKVLHFLQLSKLILECGVMLNVGVYVHLYSLHV